MKERPILFSGAMVRAILDGNKTQTRRVVKPQPPISTVSIGTYHHPDPRPHFWACDGGSLLDWAKPCPYGQPGDRLYVREAWQHANHPLGPYQAGVPVFYRADYMDDPHGADGELSPEGKYRTWRPSIHMPRSASRITLEITGVRVERLQAMSVHDMCQEGIGALLEDPDSVPGRAFSQAEHAAIAGFPGKHIPEINGFAALWDSLNGAGAWDANPWVWAVEFKKVTP